MMWRLSLLIFYLAALSVTVQSVRTKRPFYVIAHMVNNKPSFDWAILRGANAVEMDLQFDGYGNPTKFEHGGFCDCICSGLIGYHICSNGLKRSCSGRSASNDAKDQLKYIATSNALAMVIIDGKVNARWGSRLAVAGRNLVKFLDRHLFGNDYWGRVVISVGKINCYEYLRAAAQQASISRFRKRYYFTFDQEGNNFDDVAAMLSRFTKNRVFGTGTSSCGIGHYRRGMTLSVIGVYYGLIDMSYIWTLDKESSMQTYIDLGVQGIVTNRPALLYDKCFNQKLNYATFQNILNTARMNVRSPNKCDCDYHKGGCTISFPAPPKKACKCKYKGFWTCGGSIVSCSTHAVLCHWPDASLASCRLGGGDCGGYR